MTPGAIASSQKADYWRTGQGQGAGASQGKPGQPFQQGGSGRIAPWAGPPIAPPIKQDQWNPGSMSWGRTIEPPQAPMPKQPTAQAAPQPTRTAMISNGRGPMTAVNLNRPQPYPGVPSPGGGASGPLPAYQPMPTNYPPAAGGSSGALPPAPPVPAPPAITPPPPAAVPAPPQVQQPNPWTGLPPWVQPPSTDPNNDPRTQAALTQYRVGTSEREAQLQKRLRNTGMAEGSVAAQALARQSRESGLGEAQLLSNLGESNRQFGLQAGQLGMQAADLNLRGQSMGLDAYRAGLEGQRTGMEGQRVDLARQSLGLDSFRAGLEGQRTGMEGQRVGLDAQRFSGDQDYRNRQLQLSYQGQGFNQALAQSGQDLDWQRFMSDQAYRDRMLALQQQNQQAPPWSTLYQMTGNNYWTG